MEQINKYRSEIVLGLLILFLILFGFYMLVIKPVNDDVSSQKLQLVQLEKEKTLIANKINEFKGAGAAESLTQATALAAITQGDDSEGLILALQSIGNTSHARLKDIGFSLEDTNGIATSTGLDEGAVTGLHEVMMTAVVVGSYVEIHDWLQQLHTLARLITIDSFAFQQPYEFATSQKMGSILTANIAFTAYFETTAAAQQ